MTVLEQADDLAVRHKTKRRRVPGSQIRAAREHARLAQADLADLLQVRGPTISERENAEDVPWETWLAVAHVLGLPDDWSPTAEPDPTSPFKRSK